MADRKMMLPGRNGPPQRQQIKMVNSPQGIEAVRQFTAEQKKAFGEAITTIAGAVRKVDIKFPQAGGMLLGFGFTGSAPNGVVKVTVNNEVVIDDLNGAFLDLTNKQFEYFPFPRPLSATDVIKMEVTDTAVKTVFFAIYYI